MNEVGDVINARYKLDSLESNDVGTSLWRALDINLHRLVLVRIVHESHLSNAHYITRFTHDAQILSQLEHPHILPIYDYGVHHDCPFQIQRYLGARTLEDFFKDGIATLNNTDLLRLLQQVASAIDYIHSRGIYHRDIYEHNIWIDESHQPYLNNFSLATMDESHDLSTDGESDYQIAKQDEQSNDIYQFGRIAYQVLTKGHTPQFQHNRFINDIRSLNPELPLGIELVIDKLTHSNSAKRYTRAQDAIDALYKTFFDNLTQIQGKLFISYARVDETYVVPFAEQLQKLGIDIWFDKQIAPGANWDDSIQDALDECDKMVIIATEASMNSEYVTHEWSYFMGAQKPIFPLIINGQIPTNMHPRLKRVQLVMSDGDLLENVSHLLTAIAKTS